MVVALPQSEILRFPTPTKPSALPSEILLLLFAKKSTAARLTYNRTTGEWASTDRAALRNLFEWFVKFFLRLSGLLGPQGAELHCGGAAAGGSAPLGSFEA